VSKQCGTSTTDGIEVLNENSLNAENNSLLILGFGWDKIKLFTKYRTLLNEGTLMGLQCICLMLLPQKNSP
jgi:hypothetical protein